MKIAVLIKPTPDTADLPAVDAGAAARGEADTDLVINPWDEYAVEEALLLDERFGAEIIAFSVAKPAETQALKHAVAVGVGEGRLIDRTGLQHGDLWAGAAALAAAVRAEGDVELVLAGKQSVDENSGVMQVGVARKLGWPLLTNVVKIVAVADGRITVERMVDGAQETVSVALPAVVSVGKEINEPRYAGLMGQRRAAKATFPVLTVDALGIAVTSRVAWQNVRKPESRSPQVRIMTGATPAEQAAALVDALLADKVI